MRVLACRVMYGTGRGRSRSYARKYSLPGGGTSTVRIYGSHFLYCFDQRFKKLQIFIEIRFS